MAHNVVRVSYATQNYFVCYAYEPNLPFESPFPSSDPKQWDKLMAHNDVRVSYAVQNYFVCYAYEPNVPFESPYPFLRPKTVG